MFLTTNEKQTFKIKDDVSAIMIEPVYKFTTIYLNMITKEFEITVGEAGNYDAKLTF